MNPSPFRPVFVIGPPRSGTTLLRDLLGAHFAIDAHGEDFHAFHHDLGIFKLRDEDAAHFRLTAADVSESLRRDYTQAAADALQQSGRTVFLLKISTLSQQVDYVRALFPEARFIQIVRDGRDAACSMEDLRQALEKEKNETRVLGPAPDPWGLWCAEHVNHPIVRAAGSWAYHVTRSMLDLNFCGAADYRRIRYEDLLNDPENTVASLLNFLGLELCDDVSALFADISNAPTGAGSVGFSTSQAKGARLGRYENELNAMERILIAPFLHMPMQLLGYQPDPWPERQAFFDACAHYKIDAPLLREQIVNAQEHFGRQLRAFDPVRQLKGVRVTADSRPLLIDGALFGSRRAAIDGAISHARGWVQKQARRFYFDDEKNIWTDLAMGCDGERTLAGLVNAEDVPDATRLVQRLCDLGFLGLA